MGRGGMVGERETPEPAFAAVFLGGFRNLRVLEPFGAFFRQYSCGSPASSFSVFFFRAAFSLVMLWRPLLRPVIFFWSRSATSLLCCSKRFESSSAGRSIVLDERKYDGVELRRTSLLLTTAKWL